MSIKLRELTHKGDPMLRVKLPKSIHELMYSAAKENKRKIQDEVIKRIAASYKNEAVCQTLQCTLIHQLKLK